MPATPYIIVPRHITSQPILSGVLPVEGGGQAMFIDHRMEDGRIHREIRPVAASVPHFILPGIGAVDESEMAEMSQWAVEEGPRIRAEMRERRGPAPTAAQYAEMYQKICEARVMLSKGQSVSGPHHSREAGLT